MRRSERTSQLGVKTLHEVVVSWISNQFFGEPMQRGLFVCFGFSSAGVLWLEPGTSCM